MVGLVLDGAGQQVRSPRCAPGRRACSSRWPPRTGAGGSRSGSPGWTGSPPAPPRSPRPTGVDVGVDQVADLAVDVPGEDPQAHADLRGGQAGAARGEHGLGQVGRPAVRSSASKSTTGAAGVRSTGSPNSRMGVTLTATIVGGRLDSPHVTSLRAHRIRAVTSSLVEGLAVGGLLAGREAPPWSRPRVRTRGRSRSTAGGRPDRRRTCPRLLRAGRAPSGTVGPTPPEERRALVEAGARAVATGLALQLLDRPVRRQARRGRGVRHPHRWFGGSGRRWPRLRSSRRSHWRLAADRARREAELDAAIEAELQEMAAGC